MHKNHKGLTDDEFETMEILWGSGEEMHTGEIAVRLRENRTWQTSAAQSMLDSMTERGYINHEKLGRVNYYTPAITKDEYFEKEVQRLSELIFGGSVKKLVLDILGRDFLTDGEKTEIASKLK